MEHQDWKTLVLNKQPAAQERPSTAPHSQVSKKEKSALDSTEAGRHETVSASLKTQILQGRQAKKMKQSDLAKAVNVRPNVIQEYESGKAIPNPDVLRKISTALGIRLKK